MSAFGSALDGAAGLIGIGRCGPATSRGRLAVIGTACLEVTGDFRFFPGAFVGNCGPYMVLLVMASKIHRAIPSKPTWSTDIYTRTTPLNVFGDAQHLAKLAGLRYKESYAGDIRRFAALIQPILDIQTDVEPLLTIGTKVHRLHSVNASGAKAELNILNNQDQQLPKLIKLASKTEDGYYVVENKK